MRERLKVKPNTVLSKYIFEPSINEDCKRSFENIMKVNIAHVLMLNKQGLIDDSDTKELLKSIIKLYQDGIDNLVLNPDFEDFYFNVEEYILKDVGIDIGGKMHTARSRNDLNSTVLRMGVREALLKILDLFLNLINSLMKVSKENISTVMTGYTHMQPAQPITFGHYLTGIIAALQCDYQRLIASYKNLNMSPLGGVAFAGTSFDIDRDFTSYILGFDGIIENSIDAVASRDYLLEIMSVIATSGTTISRLAHDLYIWATDEFKYIEIDNSMAACSSIMPQKKNPIALEHIKAKTSHLLSSYVSIFSCLKNIPYSHCRDVSEASKEFWNGVEQFQIILRLLDETINTLTINKERMEDKISKNYCTVTELADELVKQEGISFRKSHGIVGSLVSDSLERSISADELEYENLGKKLREFNVDDMNISEEGMKNALDPSNSVGKRGSVGGPAPYMVNRFIEKIETRLKKDRAEYEERLEKIRLANDNLKDEVALILTKA